MPRSPKPSANPSVRTSWDPVATWYSGMVGKRGSVYHRKVALPTVLELSALEKGERLLDLGCGSGVLAPHVLRRGARYLGVDASRALVRAARQHHPEGTFLHGDVRRLEGLPDLHAASFEVGVFMLSIQDMDPLEEVLRAANWALKPRGRLVIFMTHPSFRVPRGSGWGFDKGRKLTYRRIDGYLTGRAVPMKAYAEVTSRTKGTTLSFHRPLSHYINALGDLGMMTDRLAELPDPTAEASQQEIPLFAALRARKLE